MNASLSPTLVASPSNASPARSAAPKELAAHARDFESLLLTQWLQAAEDSFGSVPGGDDDQDQAGAQMRSFGVQQLAGALCNAGGIGIARLVEHALAASDKQGSLPDLEQPVAFSAKLAPED